MRPYIFIIVSLLLFTKCSVGQNDTYTVEIVDGVRHVHNHAPLYGDEPKISLELVQTIGELTGDDENYQLNYPTDVTVDNAGNIFVCEMKNNRIQKFSPEGKYLLTVGRKGEGPGEFIYPSTILINKNNELIVSQDDSKKIQVFDLYGKYLRNMRIGHLGMGAELMDNGMFVMLSAFDIPRNTESMTEYVNNPDKYPLYYIYDREGKKTGGFGEPFTGKRMNFKWRSRIAADNEDNFYLGWIARNRIEKFDRAGSMIYRMDRKKSFGESEKGKQLLVGNGPEAGYVLLYNHFH